MEYYLFLLIAGIIRILPHKCVYNLGRATGSLIFAFSLKRRRIGRINLNIAFGNSKPASEKNRILNELADYLPFRPKAVGRRAREMQGKNLNFAPYDDSPI